MMEPFKETLSCMFTGPFYFEFTAQGIDKAKALDKIMNGSKIMIVRGAAGRKIPHSRVNEGEILYFMQKGSKKISAKAMVTHVDNYTKLTDSEIIEKLNNPKLDLTDKQKERWHKKCLILVEFSGLEKIEPALDFEHQGNMDDWLIIEKIEDVLVGTSIPYNYEKSKF